VFNPPPIIASCSFSNAMGAPACSLLLFMFNQFIPNSLFLFVPGQLFKGLYSDMTLSLSPSRDPQAHKLTESDHLPRNRRWCSFGE
jgi:hypothetical protein